MWSSDWLLSGKIQKVDYLHSQQCDEADNLQFDSTDEYFKTVEHELHRMLELRDIANVGISSEIHTTTTPTTPLVSHRNQRECNPPPQNRPTSKLRWSLEVSLG